MNPVCAPFFLLTAVLATAACTRQTPPTPDASLIETAAPGARLQLVKGVAMPYEKMLGAARFTSSAAYEQNGYRIESGDISLNGTEAGGLVSARGPDGAILAMVDEPGVPGKSGLWQISPEGITSFAPSPKADYRQPDTIALPPDEVQTQPSSTGQQEGPHIIDFVAGYSRAAADKIGDPVSYSLISAEMLNLSLRKSLLPDITVRVAGVRIIDEDFKVVPATLARIRSMFPLGYGFGDADLSVGFADDPAAQPPGLAQQRGSRILSRLDSTSFRHEMGHIVGGGHCNSGSEEEKDDYRFGFFNGKSGSIMCGNYTEYYSNPALTDAHGLPRGDARTADMARLWRERAPAIENHFLPLDGERLLLAGSKGNTSATLTIPTVGVNHYAGIVVADQWTDGPRELARDYGPYTRLVALVTDSLNNYSQVVLRGQRITPCSEAALPYYFGCVPSDPAIQLKISFFEEDNPKLVGGMVRGFMDLRALDFFDPTWSKNIQVIFSINRRPKAVWSLDNSQTGGAVTSIGTVEGARFLAMVATHPSTGPTEVVRSAETDFSYLTPTVTDAAGESHVIRLRAQRQLQWCANTAMNVRDLCQADGLTLKVSYFPADNPTLAAGHYAGQLQLATINAADTEHNPVRLDIKIDK